MNLVTKIKSIFGQYPPQQEESGKGGSEMPLNTGGWMRPKHGVAGTDAYLKRLNGDALSSD